MFCHLYVYLLVTLVSPTKKAELIEVPFLEYGFGGTKEAPYSIDGSHNVAFCCQYCNS